MKLLLVGIFFITLSTVIGFGYSPTSQKTYRKFSNYGYYKPKPTCPSAPDNEVFYPVMMLYSLLEIDAQDMHNGSLSDLGNYCPRTRQEKNSLIIEAWKDHVILSSLSPSFSFDATLDCQFITPTGQSGILRVTRLLIDPLKRFSVLMFCVPPSGIKRWVVHSRTQKPLDYASEKLILSYLNFVGLDTSKIFRPNFSNCRK